MTHMNEVTIVEHEIRQQFRKAKVYRRVKSSASQPKFNELMSFMTPFVCLYNPYE